MKKIMKCLLASMLVVSMFGFSPVKANDISTEEKYSLQGTTQGRYLTGGVPPVRFSM